MKICIAQTHPMKGNIPANIEQHKKYIDLAITKGADSIFFPEMSITSYEPILAKTLAIQLDDSRFNDFQYISDRHQIMIGLGAPSRNPNGLCISMLLFQPHQPRRLYSKKYLHPDEKAFFVPGKNETNLIGKQNEIALAICYEISIPEHAEQAAHEGASFYLASVAKSANGMDQAELRLSAIAKKYSMMVLLSNSIGKCDDFVSAGRSSVWNNQGLLLEQLNDWEEGIIILDTDTQKIIKMNLRRQVKNKS